MSVHLHLRAPVAVQPDRAQSLLELQRRLAGCADLASLIAATAAGVRPLLGVSDRVSLAFLDADETSLRVYRLLPAMHVPAGPLPRVRVEGTVVGQVVREALARVVADTRDDPNITFGRAAHDGIRSTASVPIMVGGRAVGAMNIGSRTAGACQPQMLEALAEVAAVVGPAVYAAERAFALATPPLAVGPGGLVGRSEAFLALIAAARRAAASDATVLITGETGVGKTALARAIHDWSRRKAAPFVPVHLADLTSTLVESELFGHERGAFTGAAARRVGRFEVAENGTIFLDEIGEAPLALQSKLLRVLHDGCFERVGGESVKANVRVIAATHRDLSAAVAHGQFRQDLFYRLNVVPLHVAPLRERPDDLEPLTRAVLAQLAADGRGALSLSPDAWRRLRAHTWPGNVRELESVLRRAAVFETGDELQLEGWSAAVATHAQARPREGWPTRDEHERRYLGEVLEHTSGVIEGAHGAARLLGLRPSTLRSRMKRLGVSTQVGRRPKGAR